MGEVSLNDIALCTGEFPDAPATAEPVTDALTGELIIIENENCDDVSSAVTILNDWSCRSCFRIRAYYEFSQFGIQEFVNTDYIILQYAVEKLNLIFK